MFFNRGYVYTPLEKAQNTTLQRLLGLMPCLKVVTITWILFLTFWIYGKIHFYRDPESMFFNSKTAYARNYSLLRENEALGYLEGMTARGESENANIIPKDNGRVTNQHMCAIISSHGSMRGRRRHPLELTLASLLSGLSPLERTDLDLRVFIANTNPSEHPFYNSSLTSLVDSVISAKDIANQELLDHLANLEENRAIANKSVIDISLALEHCFLNSTAPYIGFFEDDIVVAESWYARTRLALRDANKLASQHGQQWLDLRLFNAANEIRWTANKTPSQQALMYVTIVFSVVTLSWTTIIFNRAVRNSTGFGMSDRSTLTIALLTIPLFTLLFFRAGKSNMISRPDGVSIQPWGCCTQGTVFQRQNVPGLISAIREKTNTTAFDNDVGDYAKEKKLLRVALDPPMIQHLGFTSLVNSQRISRVFPWSVVFEDLNKEKLMEDHGRMIHELYG